MEMHNEGGKTGGNSELNCGPPPSGDMYLCTRGENMAGSIIPVPVKAGVCRGPERYLRFFGTSSRPACMTYNKTASCRRDA